MQATDIHIEVYQKKVHLRYRIDGVLRDIKVPDDIYYIEPAIISRIKIISTLEWWNTVFPGRPGKGKTAEWPGGGLKISIIPGYFGENVVIRILPAQPAGL